MNKKLRIHTEGKIDPHHLDMEEHHTVETLVRHLMLIEVIQGSQPEEIFVFEEDIEEELPRDFPIGQHHDKKHFHAHHCKRISVSIGFNGTPYTHAFGPAVRLRKVVDWAKEKCGIDAKQQCVLRVGSDQSEPLDLDAHVGSFAHRGECSAKFYLTILKGQQG